MGGGVALLAAPGVAVAVENHDARGAFSATVSLRGHHDSAIIGAYLPPRTGGAGRRSREHWRAPLVEFITAEYTRLAAVVGRGGVLIAGDLNAAWGRGPLGDWATADARTGDRRLWRWAERIAVSPVMGRVGQPRVSLTSRTQASSSLAYTAAVDFVLAANEVGADAVRGVCQFESPFFGEPQAHKPVAVDLLLRHRSCPLPLRPPPRRPYFPPTYGSEEATLLGNELARVLPAAVSVAADPTSSASAACSAMVGAVSAAAAATLADPRRCPRQRARRGIAGRPRPPAARALCEQARGARFALLTAYARGDDADALAVLVDAARARRTAARRAARAAVRRHVLRSARVLASLRRPDPHGFAV